MKPVCARCHVEKLKLYIYNNRNCVKFNSVLGRFFRSALRSLPTSAICVCYLALALFCSLPNFITLFPKMRCFGVAIVSCVSRSLCVLKYFAIDLHNFRNDTSFSTARAKQRSHRFMGIWLLIKYLLNTRWVCANANCIILYWIELDWLWSMCVSAWQTFLGECARCGTMRFAFAFISCQLIKHRFSAENSIWIWIWTYTTPSKPTHREIKLISAKFPTNNNNNNIPSSYK